MTIDFTRNNGLVFTKDNSVRCIPLKKVDVNCSIHNILVNVTSKLKYINELEESVETVFIFPLDEGSAIYHFEAQIEDRCIIAECQPKKEARANYELAVDQGFTAFLLEEDDRAGDTFRIFLGNLGPKSELTIHIKYISQLVIESNEPKQNLLRFVLPSVLNPRYDPDNKTLISASSAATVWSINDSTYDFTFAAHISGSKSICSIYSPNDKYSICYTNDSKTAAEVKLTSQFKFKHDLLMDIEFKDCHTPHVIYEKASSLAGNEAVTNAFNIDVAMINFLPDFKSVTSSSIPITKCEYIFLVDRSGSMGGTNIKNASEALLLFIKSLPVNCHFQIIGFGSRHESLFPTAVQYTEETMKQAIDYQKNLKANFGGTVVLEPLKFIYSTYPAPGFVRSIFFLTDGDVSNTSSVVSLVSQHSATTRMFAVGIGAGASTALVSGVARAGGGRAEFVKNEKEIRSKVMSLLKTSSEPVFNDVTLTWNVPDDVKIMSVPSTPAAFFSGYYLTIFGLITGNVNSLDADSKASAVLSGKIDEQVVTFEIPLSRSKGVEGGADCAIRRLAAKYQIREMCAQPEELVDKAGIEAISTGANIVSRYTSMIAIDTKKKEDFAVPALDKNAYNESHDEFMLQSCGLAGGSPGRPVLRACGLMDSSLACYDPTIEDSFECIQYKASALTNCGSFEGNSFKAKKKSMGFGNPFSGIANGIGKLFAPSSSSGSKLKKSQSMNTTFFRSKSAASSSTNSRRSSEAPNAPNAPNSGDSLIKIVDLQTFEGFWKLKNNLLLIIGLDFDNTEKAKPADVDDNSWATALVLQYLEMKCSTSKTEWSMIAEKARKWLISTTKDSDAVLKAAKSLIK